MAEVFILLGGNVGDKEKIFRETHTLISKTIGSVKKESSVYETASWGFMSENFLNQALIVETSLFPEEVLIETQKIEQMMGRTRNSEDYEARTLDIDLIFYNDLIINTITLTIPHPLMEKRNFVLIPLNEIAPEKKHPVTGKQIQELIHLSGDPLPVTKIS